MKNYLLILTTLTSPFILFTAKEVNAGKVYDTCDIGLTKPMIIKFKRNNSNRYVVKNMNFGTVLHYLRQVLWEH